jgi:hypothetical protein
VIGNDLGKFTSNIIYKLGNAGEIDVIDGFIYVNRDTGEFIIHGISLSSVKVVDKPLLGTSITTQNSAILG